MNASAPTTGPDAWRKRWQLRWGRWLDRRLPAASSITLSHRSLFVLPTRTGLAFLLVIFLLWLLGTNYENNLVFALAFLLVGVMVVLPVHTFANLAGLRLRLAGTPVAFAGDFARARIVLERSGRRCHERVAIHWPPEEGVIADVLDDGSEREIEIARPVIQRGQVRAPRVRVESTFPLGLYRCWSWVDLDCTWLVYPQPKSVGPLPVGASVGEGDEPRHHSRGGEDFAGLKPYQPGDSLRHVAWKQYAGGRDLFSREYASGSDERLWLDWDLLGGRDVETRLSNLCAWALDAERAGIAYGLRIPGSTINPSLGSHHQQQVLTALALFPVQGVRRGGES